MVLMVPNLMEVFLWIVAFSYVIVVACWWYGLFYLWRMRPDAVRLEPVSSWPVARPAPSLSVVVACHNEEEGIESCVRKLLLQDYPDLRIIMANDRSTDRTGAILARLAAEDARISVIEIEELPPDWTGKTHAVSRAVERCATDYVLFIDSDVELSPRALITVMDKACRDDVDFLSLWPHLDLRSFSEKLLTPPAMFVLALWAVPYTHGKDVATETMLGNGQFLLVKRAAYEAIGGHASVGNELAEDAILALKAHESGQRCWSGVGDGLYVTYREGDFARTVNALARVLIGSLQKQWRILVGTQMLLAGGFAAAWILPAALICLALSVYPTIALTFLILAVLHWTGMTLTLRRAFALTLVKRGSLLWFPLGAVIVTGVLFWSAYLLAGRGSVRWGTTRYRVHGSRVAPLTTK
ncbi:MAG: glycosyltransferase [Planctomycetes bacterium]|nr:glycosyltransferase [Planctomycetota bacterium]